MEEERGAVSAVSAGGDAEGGAAQSSKAAGRLLSAHVTSCATERNWSLFGNIFSKTRNRLALERAQKMAFIRTNSSNGLKGANEEILLSVVGVLDDEEDV